jgi:hypothetical protein
LLIAKFITQFVSAQLRSKWSEWIEMSPHSLRVLSTFDKFAISAVANLVLYRGSILNPPLDHFPGTQNVLYIACVLGANVAFEIVISRSFADLTKFGGAIKSGVLIQ